jgi:DNA-binding NtrC family response regulator
MNTTHVLVIDRDPLLSETISQMLRMKGYFSVKRASFGKALSTLHDIAFDAVIARIGSNEPDESIFIDKAKLLQHQLKIIIATSGQLPSPQLKSYDAVLSLPFGLDQLDDALRQVSREQMNA